MWVGGVGLGGIKNTGKVLGTPGTKNIWAGGGCGCLVAVIVLVIVVALVVVVALVGKVGRKF